MKLIRKLISRYKSWVFNNYQLNARESVALTDKGIERKYVISRIEDEIFQLVIHRDFLKRRKQKHSHIQKKIETLTARKIDLELDAEEAFK